MCARATARRRGPVWKSTSVSGAPDNSSLSHFSAMTRPCWLGRAARNRHRHAIEQASRRLRGGRRDDAARTRRKILISTQGMPVDLYDPAGLWGDMAAEKSKRGLAVEINNGRAAMLGIFGFMAASKVDGSVPALSFIKPYAVDYMQPFEGNFDLFA